ncbi:MAG: histone deacetylase [Candidatus Hydrogenedentes bacterium]|nr:histone deacetylase [Candidatus Hydrogenedentota bacterium]
MAKTAFFQCDEAKKHDTGPGHVESPARMQAILHAMEAAQLKPDLLLKKVPATLDDLSRCHSHEHIGLVQRHCASGEDFHDPDTVMGPGSWDAALLAAGGAIEAARAVLAGEADNAFVAMRPPGHHAERNRAMGFCLFNNAAIAARWLRAEAGVNKVAIFDWDVHHGNGTQHITYNDDSIYYASIHEYPLYPGTGHPTERGKNDTNLNITMQAGSGPEDWIEAIEKEVLPEFARFQPDVLIISCGFDAHRLDPLANQRLESETFGEMTRLVRPVADGKIVSLLEGGYHLQGLGESAAHHFHALQR